MNRKNSPPRADVLFITYDGLLEPLGYSQVPPYLFSHSDRGIQIAILSFEKTSDLRRKDRLEGLEGELEARGIIWLRRSYHHRPKVISTAFDIALGCWSALRLTRAAGIRLVHARSYVPAFISLVVKWLTGARFIFDMRGFWPEERIELGIFRRGGLLYRISKFFERRFLLDADQLVVLTERARTTLLECRNRPDRIEVIPCSVDIDRFLPGTDRSGLAARYDLGQDLIVGNIGAVSGMYLIPQIFRFALLLKRHLPRMRFVYLTRQDPMILLPAAIDQGLSREDILITSASPEEIPEWLSLFQLAVFFPKTCYATRAMCPTKLGEFLAAGVPVVTSGGVGDFGEILGRESVGFLIHDFAEGELSSVAAKAAGIWPSSGHSSARAIGTRSFEGYRPFRASGPANVE